MTEEKQETNEEVPQEEGMEETVVAEQPEEAEEGLEPMKFKCITQTLRVGYHNAPSGETYILNKGQPFIVRNKEDIKYFLENKRFEKVGLLSDLMGSDDGAKGNDEETVLREELEGLSGISKKTVDTVVELYGSAQKIMDSISEGMKMDNTIPEKQATKIFNHFEEKLNRGEE